MFCQAMQPPLVPYPLLASHVGAWLLARWMKPRKSNLSNTKPLVSALTYHAVHTLHLSLDVRPFPGMAHLERRQLSRVMIAIAELEDVALRRSIPLTLHLLRLAVQERVVALPTSGVALWTPPAFDPKNIKLDNIQVAFGVSLFFFRGKQILNVKWEEKEKCCTWSSETNLRL